MLHYVTSNADKIATARRNLEPLNISFEIADIQTPEIRSTSIIEIAIDKAKKAYEQLKKPVFVSDHGWFIPALNGFPGPYMKFMNLWFSSEDFLQLMKPHKDKTIIKQEIIVYVDKNQLQDFSTEIPGRFLDAPEGGGQYPAMRVVTLQKAGKSVARCQEEKINAYDENPIWNDFATWVLNMGQVR